MRTAIDWGVGFIVYLQTTFTGFVELFNFFTFLGGEDFYLLAFPLLYWTVDNKLRLRVGIFFAVSVVLNGALKLALHQPRPYWISTRVQLLTEAESTFGVPSGHAQNAVVFWGTIAAHWRSRIGWTVLGLLIFLIGISRIYLGVHFPHDTLLGFAVGTLLLVYLLHNEDRWVAWFEQQALKQRMLIVWASSLLGIALGLVTLALVNATWQLPADWLPNAAMQAPEDPIAPLSAAGFITIMATMATLLMGHIWLMERGGFDAGGTIGKRFGRFLLGVVIVILIWSGLDILFGLLAEDETVLGYLLRYVRYSAIGLWIGLGAPLLFLRTNLAQPIARR